MDKQSVDFLRRIVEMPSPSGFEQPVQKVIREHMQESCDVRTDLHGNVIGVINPGATLRVMLAGHCDEIGFIVMHISDDGFIRFDCVGGWDSMIATGQRVTVHNDRGPVPGVIGKKPIHLMDAEERKKVPEIYDMWIDIGSKNRKDAERVVAVGDPITVVQSFIPLRAGLVAARGFDDRVGAFVAAETLRRVTKSKLSVAVYGVSTVQEEIGLRGARTSSFGIDPHVGIAIDVGFATDFPTVDKNRLGEAKLGAGPMLHRGANINPVVGKMLVDVAKKHRIPYQITAEPRATGTDANAMQVNRAGCAAALVSVPNRYMHTPVEVISLKDLDNCVGLLVAFVESLKPDMDFTP
jgi:endoglucanase